MNSAAVSSYDCVMYVVEEEALVPFLFCVILSVLTVCWRCAGLTGIPVFAVCWRCAGGVLAGGVFAV